MKIGGTDGNVVLDVIVSPRARRSGPTGEHDGALKIATTAPPEGGKANAATEEIVARLLGVAPRDVEVVGGRTSRRKRVAVAGLSVSDVRTGVEHVLTSRPHEPG